MVGIRENVVGDDEGDKDVGRRFQAHGGIDGGLGRVCLDASIMRASSQTPLTLK